MGSVWVAAHSVIRQKRLGNMPTMQQQGNGKKGRNGGSRDGMVLSAEDLDMIAAYKYKPGAYTQLDNMLTPFWNWVVTLLPMWMAPNLVTFLGLLATAVAAGILTSYSPGLDAPVPGWCSALFAVALFVYQTLDAIDGKQARRTNSSSPLGQLFDHGCDTVVKIFSSVAMAASLGLGATWKTVMFFWTVEVVFYMAQWEEYHTGTLNWSNGFFGVTESQFVQMGLFLISASCGQGVWSAPMPGGWVTFSLLDVAIVVLFPMGVVLVCSSIWRVWKCKAEDLPLDERGNKLIGVWPGVLQLIPMAVAMGLGFATCAGPALPVFDQHAGLHMFMLGTVTTHLTSLMIVHHMAKSALTLQDLACPSLLTLVGVTINAYWSTLGFGESSPLDPERSLFVGSGVILASYLRYVTGVIVDICRRLGIECFRIKHTRPE